MRAWMIRAFVLALFFGASLLMAAAGDQSTPFTITISGPSQPVAEGAEVRIHVGLTNVSAQMIFVRRSPSADLAELFYTVRVRDEHGAEVNMTDHGRAARNGQFLGSQQLKVLRPGEEDEEDTVISKQFDMSAPGQYTIQLERTILHDSKDGSVIAAGRSHDPKSENEIVKSNEITVTVVP